MTSPNQVPKVADGVRVRNPVEVLYAHEKDPGAALPVLLQMLEVKEQVTVVPPILKNVLPVPNSYRIDSVELKLMMLKLKLKVVSALTVLDPRVPGLLNNT